MYYFSIPYLRKYTPGHCRLVPGRLKGLLLAGVSAFITATPSLAAEPSPSHSFSLSATMSLVCLARMETPEFDATQNTVSIMIHELCNGGSGYTLTLLHDNTGIDSISYEGQLLTGTSSGATVLATRSGAWKSTQLLTLNTSGSILPTIHGLQLRPNTPRL